MGNRRDERKWSAAHHGRAPDGKAAGPCAARRAAQQGPSDGGERILHCLMRGREVHNDGVFFVGL